MSESSRLFLLTMCILAWLLHIITILPSSIHIGISLPLPVIHDQRSFHPNTRGDLTCVTTLSVQHWVAKSFRHLIFEGMSSIARSTPPRVQSQDTNLSTEIRVFHQESMGNSRLDGRIEGMQIRDTSRRHSCL